VLLLSNGSAAFVESGAAVWSMTTEAKCLSLSLFPGQKDNFITVPNARAKF
jgi:hypothetical protein